MKKLTSVALLLFSLILELTSQQPSISMTTANLKGEYFSMILAASAETTTIQIDWGDSNLVDYTIGTAPQEIMGALAGNSIKIYGKGIFYFNVNSKNLTLLDISNVSTLSELYCSSNFLSKLDISNLKELTILNCSSNQITELNVKNSRNLKSLFCTSNLLPSLDVTKNPLLTQLYCSSNNIEILDISSNTQLITLYCSSNKLDSLDVSKNLLLVNLNCSLNNIGNLDVSLNNTLNYFWCYSNQLTEINVSNNPILSNFNCSFNNINSLDISKNTALTSLLCNSNKLTFPTLPIKQLTGVTYSYSPQQTVKMSKTLYAIGENIDLTAHLTPTSATTQFTWKTESGGILVPGIDYEETNGIFSFLASPIENIYCQMANSDFPDLVLKTEKITISSPTQLEKIFSTSNIYPNPFKDMVSIESSENIRKIELFNSTGKLLLEQKVNNLKETSIFLGRLPRGVFLIKIYGDTKVSLNKILKE